MRKYRHDVMQLALKNLLSDLEMLAGNQMPTNGASMRDLLGTAMTNAEVVAGQLKAAYGGSLEPFPVFPSPAELLDEN